MKTFEDLIFESHRTGEAKQARLFFENGYGISVVRFKMPFGGNGYASYTDNENEWEIAVLFGNEEKYDLIYNTPITEYVVGHLSSSEVTDYMRRIQELPA